MAGSVPGTRSNSISAGRTINGSISSSYESNAKPIAAMIAISVAVLPRGPGSAVITLDMSYTSYLASVVGRGSDCRVAIDTTIMRSAETTVIGTTGSSPNTV